MAYLHTVTSRGELQNLVIRVILEQKGKFREDDVIKKVMSHDKFNNFCEREKVKDMVTNTVQSLLKSDCLVRRANDVLVVNV